MVLNEISPYQFSGNGILKHELILTLENKHCIKNVARHETNKPPLHHCHCDTGNAVIHVTLQHDACTTADVTSTTKQH